MTELSFLKNKKFRKKVIEGSFYVFPVNLFQLLDYYLSIYKFLHTEKLSLEGTGDGILENKSIIDINSYSKFLGYSTLIYSYSIFEGFLTNLPFLISEYLDLPIEMHRGNKSAIDHAKKQMKKNLGIKFPDDTQEWVFIKDFQKLRNLIAHSAGFIKEKNQDGISLVSKIKHIHLERNELIISPEYIYSIITNLDNFNNLLREEILVVID